MKLDENEGRGRAPASAGSRARRAAALALALLAAPASADVVTDWNMTAIAVTSGGASPRARAYAVMNEAIHDAVNAVIRRYEPNAEKLEAPPGAAEEAAAAAAAHAVLSAFVPARKAAIDAAFSSSLAKIPDGQAKVGGVAVGEQVAHRVLAREKLMPTKAHGHDGSGRAVRRAHPAAPPPRDDDYLPPMGLDVPRRHG